jgi:hypothetical protein
VPFHRRKSLFLSLALSRKPSACSCWRRTAQWAKTLKARALCSCRKPLRGKRRYNAVGTNYLAAEGGRECGRGRLYGGWLSQCRYSLWAAAHQPTGGRPARPKGAAVRRVEAGGATSLMAPNVHICSERGGGRRSQTPWARVRIFFARRLCARARHLDPRCPVFLRHGAPAAMSGGYGRWKFLLWSRSGRLWQVLKREIEHLASGQHRSE